MRVLHLDSGQAMRGGQWQALRLAAALAARGVEVRLLAPAGSPLLHAAAEQAIDARPLSLFAARRESRWADVVHCHDARSHTLAWLASFGLKRHAPIAVSRRVAFPLRAGVLNRKKYSAAALFLSVSRVVSEQLIAAGIEPARIALVPDGVAVPPQVGDRTGGIVALDSSDPGKGRALLQQLRRPIQFTTELERALRTAKIFLYPTEQEGLGSAALAAMAHGVPVIASRVGGLKEIVRDGETGLLVENTPAAFEAAIDRLERDENLAERIIHDARAAVERDYTVERMTELTLECYRKVMR